MGMFILTVIIITVIIWLSVRKKKVRTPNVAFRQLGDRDENDAVSPSMYNQSINAMAKDYIKDELKEQGFSLFDSTLDLEVKKSVLTIIFAVVLMLNNFMILFRISSLLSIFIFLLSVILFIVFFTKFNLYGILIKRFNERQDENMEYIIASYIQQRVNKVLFVMGRLFIFLFLFIVPFMIFNKPTFLFESYGDGYQLRYYVNAFGAEEIIVPSEYKGKKVVSIRGNVFKNLDVKKITLPDSITNINGHAFENSKELVEINMPASLERLGSQAFKNCESLTSINIPKGVKEIEYSTFEGARNLKKITFEGQDVIVGAYAFKGTEMLTTFENFNPIDIHAHAFEGSGIREITLSSNMTEIKAGTFQNSDISSIDIPSSVKKIGESAFEGSRIREITLHDGLEEISENAFYNSYLIEISIPDTVTKISAHAFQDCTLLKKVKLSKNLTEIKAGTFRNSSIEEITIPEGVDLIDERAFRHCTSLKTVNIPSTLRIIGDSSFRECSSLKEITIPKDCTIGEKAFKDSPTQIKRK